MAFDSREFKDTTIELTGQTTDASTPGFSLRGSFDATGAVNARAYARDNEELLGLGSGSMESILQRGKALAYHNAALARQLGEQKKDDTATLLAMLDLIDDMQNTMAKLEEIRADLDTIDEFLKDLEDGEIELNEDGTLANEKYEEILREYEEQTGQRVDRTDADAVRQAVLDQKERLIAQEAQYKEKARQQFATLDDRDESWRAADAPVEVLETLDAVSRQLAAAKGDAEDRVAAQASLTEEQRNQINQGQRVSFAAQASGASPIGAPAIQNIFANMSIKTEGEEVEEFIENDPALKTDSGFTI